MIIDGKHRGIANRCSDPSALTVGKARELYLVFVGDVEGHGVGVVACVSGLPVSGGDVDGQLGLLACGQVGGGGEGVAGGILDDVRNDLGGIDAVFQLAVGGEGDLDALIGMDLSGLHLDGAESGLGGVEGHAGVGGNGHGVGGLDAGGDVHVVSGEYVGRQAHQHQDGENDSEQFFHDGSSPLSVVGVGGCLDRDRKGNSVFIFAGEVRIIGSNVKGCGLSGFVGCKLG